MFPDAEEDEEVVEEVDVPPETGTVVVVAPDPDPEVEVLVVFETTLPLLVTTSYCWTTVVVVTVSVPSPLSTTWELLEVWEVVPDELLVVVVPPPVVPVVVVWALRGWLNISSAAATQIKLNFLLEIMLNLLRLGIL